MTGLLLINLGTPGAPDPAAVRRYLREFLSDPRVIDIHPLLRLALVHLIILPLRPRRSSAAYRKIWSERGSPLIYHTRDLVAAVGQRLGEGWAVEMGMRYGSPSIEAGMHSLLRQGVARIVVFPLYPHYSAASTGSSVEEVFRAASSLWVVPPLSVVEPFYEDPGFLDAFTALGAPLIEEERPDHVLFSFHGLPERHLRRADASGARCLQSAGCCDRIVAENRSCYRAQCCATARGLAARLGLSPGRFSTSFQSRLGRTPWIRPYTDMVLPELARGGSRRVLVFCPAFVADCLETLEEIGVRGAELFRQAGGERLTLVPSLNATPRWADAVVALVMRQARKFAGGEDEARTP